MGVGGSLTDVLTACLVDGYGGSFASGSVVHDGTAIADGDTVTVGTITYTFRTTIGTTPYNVYLGSGSTATIFLNLAAAINGNGTAGTTYAVGTYQNPDVWATYLGTIFTLTARKGGSSGNSIVLSENSTHLTVSGANLSGGSGSVTKPGAGWSKPFTGANGQAVFRPPAGTRFYLTVDDTGPGTGGARDVRTFGWETMTAWNTGSGQFPTPAQSASGSVIRKSSLLDATTRAWTLLVDDRTFVLFTYSGDSAGLAHGFMFGDFYSFLPGDLYKCLIMGGSAESASAVTSNFFFQHYVIVTGSTYTGHWLPRNYSGAGGSTNFLKSGDMAMGTAINISGLLGFPNPADGGLYVAPIRVIDGSTPGTTMAGTLDLRGRIRGLYHIPHAVAGFADGDTFSGVGDYAGRTFMVVKGVGGSMVAIETTAWDVST